MEDITVSICSIAYNAEKYIRQTIDGFLMQKCNFKYEIILHDDASTDNTALIIKEYEQKYPDLIHAIYQTENQYSQGSSITREFVYPIAKGKYIALCEGDDFWTDPYKLQKQVDALEANLDCHMCIHKVKGIKDNGDFIGIMHPNFSLDTGKLTSKKFVDLNCTNEYVFQTSSYFMLKSDIDEYVAHLPEFARVSATGDFAYMMYFATKGNIYYINDTMSCYRYGSTSSDARKEFDGKAELKLQAHFNKQIQMMKEYDKYTNGIYHKYCVRKINGYGYDKAIRNKDYKEMIKFKYHYFFKHNTAKFKIKAYCYAFLPSLVNTYDSKKK